MTEPNHIGVQHRELVALLSACLDFQDQIIEHIEKRRFNEFSLLDLIFLYGHCHLNSSLNALWLVSNAGLCIEAPMIARKAHEIGVTLKFISFHQEDELLCKRFYYHGHIHYFATLKKIIRELADRGESTVEFVVKRDRKRDDIEEYMTAIKITEENLKGYLNNWSGMSIYDMAADCRYNTCRSAHYVLNTNSHFSSLYLDQFFDESTMTIGKQFGNLDDCTGPLLTGMMAFSEVGTIVISHFTLPLENELKALMKKIETLAVAISQQS